MKKVSNNTLAAQRELIFSMYGETCSEEEYELSDLDSAIADCEEMVRYSIERCDKEEVAYWRKLLQENKVLRRQMCRVEV